MAEQTPPAEADEKTQIDPAEHQPQDITTELVFSLRESLKKIDKRVQLLGGTISKTSEEQGYEPIAQVGEMLANVALAHRHLEDAAMRLGKVLQAKNGGVSILSK